MEFFVNLIRAIEQGESDQREKLDENCTHITKDLWFFEGDLDCLKGYGVNFEVIEEDLIVPSLGDLAEDELIELAGITD
jgi:hypothetical protein